MPPEPEFTDEDVKQMTQGNWRLVIVRWLAAQGVSTVLLCLILLALLYGMKYAMETAIPQHLDTIQKGYDRIGERHDKSLERMADSLDRAIDRMRSSP